MNSPHTAPGNPAHSPAPTLLLTPRRAGLRAGEDNIVEVLLRVQADDVPAGHAASREPLAVALVIDRSGSMKGQPLAEAMRCAESMCSRLRPADHVSVVDFDHRVRCLLPARPLGDGSAVRAALAQLQAGGHTNQHGGWQAGANTLAELQHVKLRRVILLSDGCANVGTTDSDQITRASEQMAQQGITTSSFGLGPHFDEHLMMALEQCGRGGSYYGETAQDLMEPFERKLDLFDALCFVDLQVSLGIAPGAQASWLNELRVTADGWQLPDLAWGSEAWAVLRLNIPQGLLPAEGQALPLMRVTLRARPRRQARRDGTRGPGVEADVGAGARRAAAGRTGAAPRRRA